MPDTRVLFGATSPLIVDYEETLARLTIELRGIVSLGGPTRAVARTSVVSLELCEERHREAPYVPCAFTPVRRRAICDMAEAAGFTLAEALVDPSAVLARSARIGPGSFLNALVALGAASIVGTCVVVNRAANIGHHCILSDFCSIGPGASLAGNVRVGENAVVGTGAVVLPDVRIGDGAIVAGGAVVRKDVPAGTLVSGNPARLSKLRPSRSSLWRTTHE